MNDKYDIAVIFPHFKYLAFGNIIILSSTEERYHNCKLWKYSSKDVILWSVVGQIILSIYTTHSVSFAMKRVVLGPKMTVEKCFLLLD